MSRSRAVFLDRDGVLVKPLFRDGRSYAPRRLEDFHLIEEALPACEALVALGFKLIVVTNQPDVIRGEMPAETLEAMHAQLQAALPLDAIKVSTGINETDPTYKPGTALLEESVKEFDIDLRASFMIGDRWRDIDCGHRAGCKTLFIDYGYTEKLRAQPDYTIQSIADAVPIISRDTA